MIRSFFQSLDREGVAYLLISGQAAILYGAAAFSEDVDIWIKPTASNASALLKALRSQGARYYKLTPPLQAQYLRRGHGFHFCIPGAPECYLDVLGKPPRVLDFDAAAAAATTMATAWGPIPTIGIKHLVSLKMTQRLGDYPVIGRLVLRYIEAADHLPEDDIAWVLAHIFTAEDLKELLAACPEVVRACTRPAALRRFAEDFRVDEDVKPEVHDAVEMWLARRMQKARRADRAYWQPIIAELRDLRSGGKLMPVGHPV
jgi:hypothetical protein